MNKKCNVLFIILAFLFGISGSTVVAKDSPHTFEEDLFEIGFKPVQEAIEACEAHFGKKIVTPYKLPPIPFQFYLGRCSNSYGINDSFQMDFINENLAVYSIRMRPIEHRINFMNELIAQKYKLKNGSTASLLEIRPGGPYFIVFEKNDWQYTLQVNSKEPNIVTPEILVEIADSVEPLKPQKQ
jgi:hypothetical protein